VMQLSNWWYESQNEATPSRSSSAVMMSRSTPTRGSSAMMSRVPDCRVDGALDVAVIVEGPQRFVGHRAHDVGADEFADVHHVGVVGVLGSGARPERSLDASGLGGEGAPVFAARSTNRFRNPSSPANSVARCGRPQTRSRGRGYRSAPCRFTNSSSGVAIDAVHERTGATKHLRSSTRALRQGPTRLSA
jgi:hypothetical protein